jgi:predicted dehydrogenase
MKNKSVTLVIIGAGGRGFTYARYAAQYPDLAQVVGVAEPRPYYREKMAAEHLIPPGNVVADWQELAQRERFADAVVIATPDALHTAPAIAFAQKGYDLLLEKPMAPTACDCEQIVQAVQANGGLFAVAHVMRYTSYTQKLKALLDLGIIGEIISLQHLEPVGFWHQAHSFVRGNWRNTAESSFMLLAKSCHDIDWLRYIIGKRCLKVSSFGSLTHFKKSQKPPKAGAAQRCLECAFEPECPYSASQLYLGFVESGYTGWPVDILTPDLTPAGVRRALQEGPYGRCVYECDNDVVDHQVVNLLYEGGATASFTMTAFSEQADRKTTIFGTRGELRGDGQKITVYDFLTRKTRVFDTLTEEAAASGHGGGDYGLMQRFVAAVSSRDASLILSGAQETLETHWTTFQAEQSRLEGQTLDVE